MSEASASVDSVLKAYSDNPLLWGMMYFPHYFRKESPAFHLRILKEAMASLWLAVQAPRGSAKSVIINFLKGSHSIVFNKKRFIIIIQNTYAKSAASLANLKLEFRDNKKLAGDFKVKMVKDAEGDTVFKKADGSLTRVLCKGADQLGSIRGERFGAYRPDLIIIDDLEDDEMVRNPERRIELEKEFNEVLNYAGENGETQILVIGTILHDDSLMAKLVSKDNYKRFKKLFYKARYDIDGNKVSIWEQKWTVDDLNYMEQEDPVGFAKEMQGDPSSGSLETIRREDFRYWKIENNEAVLFNEDTSVKARWSLKDCKAAIGVDLAWESDKAADYSAIVPAFLTPSNEILVEDFIAKKGLRPDDLEEILFSMSARLEKLTGKRVQIGFEKAKLEKVMKWFLAEAQKRRNEWLWVRDIKWGTNDKILRILARLGNRYSQHSVFHKRGMGDLENQLIRLRSTAHDDIVDALGMIPEMLAFAPDKKKVVDKEDTFDFLRRQQPRWRDKNKSKYIFGSKQPVSLFKTKVAF